jgi:hypothetical protein
MRQVIQTYSFADEGSSGVTAPVPLDQYISPFNVSLAIVPTDTATYTVQYTFDDPFTADFDAATATWFNHPDLTSESGNNDGNFAFPVRATRLNVSAADDNVTFYVTQAGI